MAKVDRKIGVKHHHIQPAEAQVVKFNFTTRFSASGLSGILAVSAGCHR